MIRHLRSLSLLAALLLGTGLGTRANPVHKVKTADGTTVGIEACADGIYRIHVSPRKDFSESLMERYGLLRTDWAPAGEKISDGKRTWTLTTPGHVLSLDKKSGTFSLRRSDGTVLVRALDYIPGKDASVSALSKVINDAYADLHVAKNSGIIGDENNRKEGIDNSESGDPLKASVLRFTLAGDERFYGGGSTSRDHIQHRGELLRMWTTYQHTEIPMPFMMSSRGWAVYNNTTRKNFFDVGHTDKDRFNIYNTSDEADFYLLAAPSMKDLLGLYTRVTGGNYVLPKWAYGLCFGPNMREDQWDILHDAVLFRQLGVPCDIFWLEPQWMEKRYDFSTAKRWNFEKFSPEPYWLQDKFPKQLYNRLFIGKLRNMGYHLGLWLCEEYDLSITEEDEIAARLGKPQSGQEHWMDHLKTFLDYGVEGFKLDPARTIDEHPDASYYNGRTDKEMHNLNQVLLQKQMNLMTREHLGRRIWYHYTAGWAGTQHWGASTSGDNGGGKTALFDQLNLGNSAYMNLSCDVMSVPKELEMQGLHFGLFLPWVQINSWFSMMQPFYYGEPEQSIYRDYVQIRYALMPYIYSAALEGGLSGLPIVRSMPLMFPEDRQVDDMCYQYMFGDNLCVGIFSDEIYLPAGTWIDAWTGERVVSKGETLQRSYPDNRAGLLFIRDGAILPCIEAPQSLSTHPFDWLIVKVFPSGDSSYLLYEDDGDSYGYESGRVASTLLESHAEAGEVRLLVHPTEGSYEGMPATRDYVWEIALQKAPASVSVGGRKSEAWTFGNGILRIAVEEAPVSEPLELKITLGTDSATLSGDQFQSCLTHGGWGSPTRTRRSTRSSDTASQLNEEVLY
ncbi:MAG: DUF5110 domain-containing protein [Bacteroidales bacterium]|nr:DUF5110 domain-containing protein [Bacteroidales bacterium]